MVTNSSSDLHAKRVDLCSKNEQLLSWMAISIMFDCSDSDPGEPSRILLIDSFLERFHN